MDTKKYIVKLTPHDKFFFGGEHTFGENNEVNYFVKSNYFPQQTGILGLVRYQLLLQCNNVTIFKGNKIQDTAEAEKLIGATSFRMHQDIEFGAIKQLSPIFICDKGKAQSDDAYYFPANKEYQWHTKLDDRGNKIEINDFLEISLENIPELEKYDAKFGLPDLLINKNNNRLKYDSVFLEHKQVGIRKKYEGGTNDKSYHVQTFYRFEKDFCFAFIVELAKGTIFESQKFVNLGGEQESFDMEVKSFEDNNQNELEFINLIPDYKKSNNSDKIVIVCDAYVEEDILDVCNFAITETVDFKFLETKTKKEHNYYSNPTKSSKHNLYKKGSVFYGNTAEIEKKLKNDQFQKLGYNTYKIINKK